MALSCDFSPKGPRAVAAITAPASRRLIVGIAEQAEDRRQLNGAVVIESDRSSKSLKHFNRHMNSPFPSGCQVCHPPLDHREDRCSGQSPAQRDDLPDLAAR